MESGRDAAADRLWLGVDGGATGCRARLATDRGETLGEGLAGPANARLDLEHAIAAILDATASALDQAGLAPTECHRMVAGLGIAGLGQARDHARFVQWQHPFRALAVTTDADIACIGAHGGGDGGIVVVGTGSCAVARLGRRVVRLGGWGFPISDQGSGARIGLRALQHTLAAGDGLVEASAMTAAVFGCFNGDPEQAVAWLETAGPRHYAELVPLVVDAAAQGDRVANGLLDEAAVDIGSLVMALDREGAPRISVLGGLAPILTPRLPADAASRLSEPLGDALDGAILLARQQQAD